MLRRTTWMVALALGACGGQASSTGSQDEPGVPMSIGNPNDHVQLDHDVSDPTVVPPTVIDPLKPPTVEDPPLPTTDFAVEVVIPRDERDAVQAATPPPPISGGTLLISADGKYAVAADPDRDRVSIVDLSAGDTLLANIPLEPGDEPGRLVEDDNGRVHVALRRAGAVVSIDLATQSIVGRRDVCANPRGLAFSGNTYSLMIACANGQLMSLNADPFSLQPATERARVEPDLRDIAVAGGQTFVSRFKRAELVTLAADGSVSATILPPQLQQPFPEHSGAEVVDSLTPTFAWRTLRASDGSMFMLHQEARAGEIDLEAQTTGSVGAAVVSGPYGGGAATCGGVVQSALTRFDANGAPQGTVRLPGVVPVDAALNSDGSQIAVVFAGSVDQGTPARTLEAVQAIRTLPLPSSAGVPFAGTAAPNIGQLSVMVFDAQSISAATLGQGACMQPQLGIPAGTAFEPIAVASAAGRFVVQLREPAQLVFLDSATGATTSVALGGDSVADTGHTLFHHDAGGGVACASCHAEGGEDGHVWHFSGFGPRRSQALNIGLEGTAPFHWGGDMAGMSELMEEVLVTRMGGVHESPARQDALQRWLFALQPLAPIVAAYDPAALRGKALFEGAAACASCHRGEKLTDNANADVGTGESVQVPSLVGVGYRGPWLHTGCANTLRDRFDPACGGDQHGKTAELSEAELDDLVAYLQSL